jgi:hypothetical protein
VNLEGSGAPNSQIREENFVSYNSFTLPDNKFKDLLFRGLFLTVYGWATSNAIASLMLHRNEPYILEELEKMKRLGPSPAF